MHCPVHFTKSTPFTSYLYSCSYDKFKPTLNTSMINIHKTFRRVGNKKQDTFKILLSKPTNFLSSYTVHFSLYMTENKSSWRTVHIWLEDQNTNQLHIIISYQVIQKYDNSYFYATTVIHVTKKVYFLSLTERKNRKWAVKN